MITKKLISICVAIAAFIPAANAQYYEMANQLTNLISPALSGSAAYKGFVEVSGLAGVGNSRANFIGLSTSQGFRYSNWFFMGAGMGIDVAMARDDFSADYDGWHGTTKTKAMLPIFSDFRFNIGNNTANSMSFFIDLKVGAAWLLGNDFLRVDENTFMGNGAQFYFRPSIGVRMPVSSKSNQAINIGITYQLLTSDNNYSYDGNSVTLSAMGASVSFEW